ncbi:30S ribosomal protein S8 [bacterium]|nr:MAG: 30S ribosomal protein S8 [bacterium]
MDKVAEFLTRIRNAGAAKHEKVDVPASKLREGVAAVLKDAGYVKNFKVVKDGKQGMMRVYLAYKSDGSHAITSVRRSSRPGRRYYVSSDQIPSVRSGYGMAIISTSSGIMGSKEATEKGLGGEVLCTLY